MSRDQWYEDAQWEEPPRVHTAPIREHEIMENLLIAVMSAFVFLMAALASVHAMLTLIGFAVEQTDSLIRAFDP